jgi:subtilisin family serine protease/putative cell wall-binding protein
VTRALATLLALFSLLGTALPVAANDDPGQLSGPVGARVIPGQVVVKWRDASKGPEVADNRGLAMVAELGDPGKGMPALLSTEGRSVDDVLAELRADPAVAYAEPDYRVALAVDGSTAVSVNDPMTSGQYSLDQMRVRDAWSLSTGGANVVAVLDTGVQFAHPDLAGRLLTGHDFVNNDGNAADDNGHGTWVSGIIAANANDGYGIAGVSWSDKILPVKIMDRQGEGSTSDLTAGIIWAADQGADVINMSVGGFPYSQFVQDAINYAWGQGAVLIGAAGNNRREESFYPASFANVVSVSGTQVDDEFSNWSSFGPNVDLSAPGASVLTTNCTTCTYADHNTWGSHTYISGTSFATPNVAGVVALIRARFPVATNQQVVDTLFGTVDDLGYPGWDNRYGRGRVNAYRAMGANIGGPGPSSGDAIEPNDTLAAARGIALNTTVSPSLYPAGDVDVFAVDLPSPGRLDVSVTGVVDTRAYPWNRSGLPMDPIIELYGADGTLLRRVDNEWETGTELATHTVGAATRVLIRVVNYYANGNRQAYAITPSFVDALPPNLLAVSPGIDAVRASYDGTVVTATFSEPVSGVTDVTFTLSDPGGIVPASVSYDAATNQARLTPARPLLAETLHTASLTSGIVDAVGLSLSPRSWNFTTGKAVPRLAGADRYATSAAVSASAFGSGVPVAYVATGASFPDALAGGPAARIGGGPLLLTAPAQLPAATAGELARLRPGRIVVLGGAGAVSNAVLEALRAYTAGSVTRVSGPDRYATAAAISYSAFGAAQTVYVATGTNYPDALAGGAAAARGGVPILLVTATGVPGPTASELARLRPSHIVVMGGTGVISQSVVAQLGAYAPNIIRIAGPDRYATAVALSATMYPANGVDAVYLATGASFPDGLSAGPVAGLVGAPLLLVPQGGLPGNVASELVRLDPSRVVFVGGTGVISETVRSQVRALWP